MLRRNNILLKFPYRILYSIFLLLFISVNLSYGQPKKSPNSSSYNKSKITPKPGVKSTAATKKPISKKATALKNNSKAKNKSAVKTKEDLAVKNVYKRVPSSIFRENQNIIEPKHLVILDSVATYLLQNPTMKMEIGVHTDSRWEDENNAFTDNRSKVICNYLEYKGVSKTRLVCKGYGKTKPLVSDIVIKRMKTAQSKEMAHQKNRRIEFKAITN